MTTDQEKDKLASIKSNEELLSQMDKLLNVTKDYSNLVKDVNKKLADLKDPYLRANKLAENLVKTTVDIDEAQTDLLKSEQLLNAERRKFDIALKQRGITEQELSDQIKENYEKEKFLLSEREDEQKTLQQNLLSLQSSMMAKMQTLETDHLDLVIGLEAQIQQVRIKAAQDRLAIANGSAQDLQAIELEMMQKVEDIQSQIRDSNKRLQSELILEKQYAESEKLRLERESKDKIMQLDEQLMQNRQKIKDLEPLELSQKEYQIRSEIVDQDRERLKTEQMVSQQIGFSGKMAQALADKLGFGKQAQEAMTLEARRMVAQNGKVVGGFKAAGAGVKGLVGGLGSALKAAGPLGIAATVVSGAIKVATMAGDAMGGVFAKAGGVIKGLSEDSADFFTNLTGPLNEMLNKIPLVGGLLSGLVTFWASILDLIVGVDDRIVKTGREVGLSASQARALNSAFAAAAASSNEIYVNSKSLMEAYAQLVKISGLNNMTTQSNLKSTIELTKFVGLESDTINKIYETSLATGTSMKSITGEIMAINKVFAKSTGIAFNNKALIKEITSLSGRLGLQFSLYPKELTKSLLAVKSLGLELKDVEQIGDKILNFEELINNQFETELLTGKQINLVKAAQLYNEGKLSEAAKEISSQGLDAYEFSKLRRLEQQSYADLFGKSVDDMANFLTRQRVMLAFNAENEADLRKNIELAEQDSRLKDDIISKIGLQEYENAKNLSTLEKLNEAFTKIKQSLVDFLTSYKILEKVQSLVDYLAKPENIRSIVNELKGVMMRIFDFAVSVTDIILQGIQVVSDVFFSVKKWFDDDAEEIETERKRVAFNEGVDKVRVGLESGLNTLKEGASPTYKESEVVKTKDAYMYGGKIIQPDKLDYSFITKEPYKLFNPPKESVESPQINDRMIKQIISEVYNASNNRPIIVQSYAKLELDNRTAAQSVMKGVKNEQIMNVDKTFGPMSINNIAT